LIELSLCSESRIGGERLMMVIIITEEVLSRFPMVLHIKGVLQRVYKILVSAICARFVWVFCVMEP